MSTVLGSPHLGEEGVLVGILNVLEIGRGDLHFMWLNRSRDKEQEAFRFRFSCECVRREHTGGTAFS